MPAAALALAPEADGSARDYSRYDATKMPKGGRYGLEVGHRLRQRRDALGLKQEEVAERSKGAFARVAYTNYENGEVVPGPEKIFSLAEALETTAKWLYFGDDGDLIGNITIHQSEFKAGRWQDSGKSWGLNRDWLARTFPNVNPDAIQCAEVEKSESSVNYRGDVVLVDSDIRPSEKADDFIYSAAGSVHVGEVVKVSGGYELRDKNGKPKGVVAPAQVRFLGRVIGAVATMTPDEG